MRGSPLHGLEGDVNTRFLFTAKRLKILGSDILKPICKEPKLARCHHVTFGIVPPGGSSGWSPWTPAEADKGPCCTA